MGNFSLICSASGLGIDEGTPVRCLLLTQSPYEGADPRNTWIVRAPPLRAKYDDCGSIEHVHPDDARIAELWLRGLREDAIERSRGGTARGGSAGPLDLTLEGMFDAIQVRRIKVIQDARNFWSRPMRGSEGREVFDWTATDDVKALHVGLAMIREDVWQAIVRFPHSTYISDQCPKKLAFEHVLKRSAHGAYAWYGLDAFKFGVREAWSRIRRQLLHEHAPEEQDSRGDFERVLFADLDAALKTHRKAEELRRAALTDEERVAEDVARKGRCARREAEERWKLEHPFFGDFRITSLHYDAARDLPGGWMFVDSTPGVIGISEHFSMLLADKTEPWDGLLDGIAELAAARQVLSGVGVVIRPSESTGPQWPKWGESARFARMTLAVATAAGKGHEGCMLAPAALDEIEPDEGGAGC